MKVHLSIRPWAYIAGRNEDGEEVFGESYSVVATLPSGRRFAHFKAYKTVEPCTDEYGEPNFRHDREAMGKAIALLAKIQAAVNTGRYIAFSSSEYWMETDPEYGSDWYQSSGQEEINRQREKEAEGIYHD